jgi:hypothetical protein
MTNAWFKVDREGLRKLVEDRGKAMVLYELVQNAWDTEGSTRVDVIIEKLPGRPAVHLVVRDNDPNGFADLAHAYTLFAESTKKNNPEQRGRFNLGEKLVLALCRHATIRSTTGAVTFHEDGTLTRSRERLREGSEFEAEVRMNVSEYDEFVDSFWKLIPPSNRETTLNGLKLPRPRMLTSFDVQLPTLISDDAGVLRQTKRITHVEVFEVPQGRTAWIYEMGIPIVETGDKYHVNIGQKVPLNMDRDNVPPAYLRTVRAAVLNHTAKNLSQAEASEAWVTNALEAKEIEPEAVVMTVEARFGKKRAIYDPSDREANMALTGSGYTVIPGAALPKAAWAAVRAAGAAQPSGKIAPTPKPYSDDPDAPEVEVIPRAQWTKGMAQVEEITRWCAKHLRVHNDLLVTFVKSRNRTWSACFGRGLDWNVGCLGKKWFDEWYQHPVHLIDIIIHELAHSKAGNHLDHGFHKACTWFGAELMIAATMGAEFPHFDLVREHLKKT